MAIIIDIISAYYTVPVDRDLTLILRVESYVAKVS